MVEAAHVGVHDEGIGLDDLGQEILLDIEQPGNVEAEQRKLVKEVLSHASVIRKCSGDEGAAEFRPILVGKGQGNIRCGDVGAFEYAVGQAQELRETDGGGDTHFRGIGVGPRLELEVSLHTHVQALSPVENVLVVVVDLWRDAKQARGVEGAFQIGLDGL